MMDSVTLGVVVLAGICAGAINSVVGSGSLVTFPLLIQLGYAPLVANVSNTVGLVPGAIAAAYGYRRELAGQRLRVAPLVVVGAVGGLLGSVLLLALPTAVFERIIPVLICCASLLVLLQPLVSRVSQGANALGASAQSVGPVALGGVLVTGIYGGYFGAAQGVILMALLMMSIRDNLQQLNGLKNLVTVGVNGVAAVAFLLVAPVDLEVVVLISGGSLVGGLLGARVARRIPPRILRGLIVMIGFWAAFRVAYS